MTTRYAGDGIWQRRVSVENSDIQLPIEIQGRYAEPVQTQNAVSIGANATSTGSWVQVDGFDKVGVNVIMTSGTGMVATIETSFDGSTKHGGKTVYTGADSDIAEELAITAPYIRLGIKNTATAAKTTTAHLYLKA